MARDLLCPYCRAYVGNCGHVIGGFTGPVTLSGTCPKCEKEYSVTCPGDCIEQHARQSSNFEVNISAPSAHGSPPNQLPPLSSQKPQSQSNSKPTSSQSQSSSNYEVHISQDTVHGITPKSKVKMECPTCGGTGKILKTCPLCNGAGMIKETIKDKCSRCGGRGQILGECVMCHGTGLSNTGNMCHGCGGTGKVYKFCPSCNGTGEIEKVIKKDCPRCYTQGQIVVECPTCKGFGEI